MNQQSAGMGRYEIRDDGAFVVRDYHRAKPFSSFLPGVAGVWGIPLWLYYVNRGQAVACFGTQNKDHAFLEFQSANLHHRRIYTEGFRTFIKLTRDGKTRIYEPFQANQPHSQTTCSLTIRAGSLHLEETNTTLGLRVNVDYFTIPNEPFAALSRTLRITDLSGMSTRVEVLDGLPKIIPYGEAAMFLQVMPFITEAYLQVENVAGKVPFLFIKAKPSDISETEFVTGGNFFFGFDHGNSGPRMLQPIVDPEIVFGDLNDLSRPYAWAEAPMGQWLTDLPAMFQAQHCTTPCAFLAAGWDLKANTSRAIHSIFGYARKLELAKSIPAKVMANGYLHDKSAESDTELQKIKDHCFIHSGSTPLNHYVPNTFLDNVLRGGLPLTLPSKNKRHVFHVYSRRHGDLERDYNFFLIEPTFFSQGNGAFRDVNQNRRSDVWFNPDVAAQNVRFFFNLVQPDGYNPMQILGAMFVVADKAGLDPLLKRAFAKEHRQPVADFLAKPFSPGRLFQFLADREIDLKIPAPEFLEEALGLSDKVEEAEYESGYWTDHWYYNFDLLESFVAIYPDHARDLLVEQKDFTYWDPFVRVLPRDHKYVLRPDGAVRHIQSLEEDKEYHKLIDRRREHKHLVRKTKDADGEVYTSNLLGKIVCLLTNKAATIAASGVGIDTDGGRPGWLDSINGIPSLFASSISESFQLLRAIRMLRDLLHNLPDDFKQPIPAFLHDFLQEVWTALRTYLQSKDRNRDHIYWEQTSAAKEQYRQHVYKHGFACKDVTMTWAQIRAFFAAVEQRILASMPKAIDKTSGLPVTYVMHEAQEFTPTGQRHPRGFDLVKITKFKPHHFPLFLEAPTHALTIETNLDEARRLWRATRQSPLYDRKLQMYILTDSVSDQSKELGRIWAWPPGWFENENVFLHMEHKYLLATLKAGLYEEFFEDFRNCLIPFQPVEVYGRNPLENASFIVSSRHPRPAHHGRGYLPRSSGTTAEVLQMLLWMSFGRRPFTLVDGRLTLQFDPILPAWMFTEQSARRRLVTWSGKTIDLDLPANSYTALFLGHTLVTYVGQSPANTYGPGAVRPVACKLRYNDNHELEAQGHALPTNLALDVRNRKVASIEVELR